MSRLQVTIHENDIYTVDEEKQMIGVSDQCKALFGPHGAEQAQEALENLKTFITGLNGFYVDINYSKDPAPVKEDSLFSKELPRQKMHTTSYR